MKKEFGAEDYVGYASGLLKATSTVVSNLAFNAAGLNEGDEDVHRGKLLKSIIFLKTIVDGLLGELADEEEIKRAERALAADSIEAILQRIRKKEGE
ncbi:hypothetical protein [uncultured Slackia sp.]|uniref:hypothetical protein n=1 Tax=uncultured Slackia sp. TaxID=665903 RepID=UPI0025F82FE9|nr:hypothetical protein [uncultured Slackia sp.]